MIRRPVLFLEVSAVPILKPPGVAAAGVCTAEPKPPPPNDGTAGVLAEGMGVEPNDMGVEPKDGGALV
jgi:hypothetical protein